MPESGGVFHDRAMNASSLPASLKGQRTGQSLTIEQLSKRSGVSRAMISKIERGEATPTTSTLGKLAAALDVSISQMIGGPKDAGLHLSVRPKSS